MEPFLESEYGRHKLLDADGSPSNVTAESILREVELLEKLIDAIPVMIVIWDPSVQVLRFNREFERVLGWTSEDAEREDFMERLYPDPEYRSKVASFMESLQPGWRDFDVTAKDGETVTTSWANIRLSDSRRVGIGVDVRDRRRAERELRRRQEERLAAYEALERQHELLTSVLELMPAGVFIANAEGDLIETNAAARQLWGGEAPHVNRSAFDQYKGWFVETGERLQADDWGIARALRGEEVLDGQEVEIETFDGRRKTILNYALPIRIGDRFEGAVAVSVDITKLRATEHALRELNATLERRVAERTADLEARNKELEHFAFIASHDLREPLRKIQAFGDLLKEDGDELSQEKADFFIDRIQSAAKRMDDLLDDLLTFSRVAMRTRPFRQIRLADVVDDARSDLMLSIGSANADIDVDADAYVEADEGQIRQLMHHLIGNAVKFRREGVRPHVRITAEADGEKESEICRIVVEDNGIGFDEKYSERIFEPFERLHERGAYEGTGIGLAICRRIVQLHRGSITAESTPGQGSRFVVEIPARADGDNTQASDL